MKKISIGLAVIGMIVLVLFGYQSYLGLFTSYNTSLLEEKGFGFVLADDCDGRGGDSDGDDICDIDDNCEGTSNPDQKDSDDDGIGDVCDGSPHPPTDPCEGRGGDSDGDDICDIHDNCESTPNPDQKDSDGDGIGDVCDTTPVVCEGVPCHEEGFIKCSQDSGKAPSRDQCVKISEGCLVREFSVVNCTGNQLCYKEGSEYRGVCKETPKTCEERGLCGGTATTGCYAKTACPDGSEICGTCPETPKTCEERGLCGGTATTGCYEKTACPDGSEVCGTCPETPKTCEERGLCGGTATTGCYEKTTCPDGSRICGTCPVGPERCEDYVYACNPGALGPCIMPKKCSYGPDTCGECETPPTDPCAGVMCQDTIRTCAYGPNMSCKNICKNGVCTDCHPNDCKQEPTDPCDGWGGDSDGDTICDEKDNCPYTPNKDQKDTYGNAKGDACESKPLPRPVCLSLSLGQCKNGTVSQDNNVTCGKRYRACTSSVGTEFCEEKLQNCQEDPCKRLGGDVDNDGVCNDHDCDDTNKTETRRKPHCYTPVPTPPDPCAGVVCQESIRTCAYGGNKTCTNSCSSGTCSQCVPDACTPPPKPVDPCAGIVCQESIRICAYGGNKTCPNTCSGGTCSKCNPNDCDTAPPPPPPPTNPDPVDGKCSSTYGYCKSGIPTLVSYERKSCGTEKRSCIGYHGGGTDSCSVTTPCPKDARCGKTVGTCSSGSAKALSRSRTCGYDHIRTCVSNDGGESDYCHISNPCTSVDGVCGGSYGACRVGTVSQKRKASRCGSDHTWTCTGEKGGDNAYCSEENRCKEPCANRGGDRDDDGICDRDDNCKRIYNPRQRDNNGYKDNRGDGDACEDMPDCHYKGGDSDNDGVCNDDDNCPYVKNPRQEDRNGYLDDGWKGDACEHLPSTGTRYVQRDTYCKDSDEDGLCDEEDYCPLLFGFITNYGCPAIINPLEIRVTSCTGQGGDLDRDGVCDYVDVCPNKSGTPGGYGCPSLQKCPEGSTNDGNGGCISLSGGFIGRQKTRSGYACARGYIANNEGGCTAFPSVRENNRRNTTHQHNGNWIGR